MANSRYHHFFAALAVKSAIRRKRNSQVSLVLRGFGGASSFSTATEIVSNDQAVHNSSSRFHHCLVLGAAALTASSSAAVSFLGRKHNSNGCVDCCKAHCSFHDFQIGCRRGIKCHSNTNCSCEPNISKNHPITGSGGSSVNGVINDVRDSKSTQDCAPSKTVSTLFDMAQQWANNYTRGESKDGEIPSSTDAKSRNEQITPPFSDRQTAEADLLSAMGISGGNANCADHSLKGGELKQDVNDMNTQQSKTNVLQRMMMGFDEFKSNLPNLPSAIVDDEDSTNSMFAEFLSLAKNASSFATTKSSNTSPAPPSIDELIQQAQRIAKNYAATSSSQQQLDSFGVLSQQVLYFQQNAVAIQRAFESAFGNTQYFADISAVKDIFRSVNWFTALYYYLEQEDSIKTPSWKRRMHRYQRDVEIAKVEELNEALVLCELSYADSVDDIRAGLEKIYHGEQATEDEQKRKRNKPHWELLFCDTESRPNEPSHFLAIQKNSSPYDDVLHVLMVVRGTKTMPDLITDAMMEATDYEYAPPGSYNENHIPIILRGKAHGGMQESGKYLVDRHQKLLSTLLHLSKKRKIDITLIGHSLGAGAATIAAMEWNSKQSMFERENNDATSGSPHGNKLIGSNCNDIQVSAHVIGFGCPALLSQPLSNATKDFVTTVIADADFIPRMSGATLVNLLLDVKDFDYQNQAERDVEQALREVQNRFSSPTFKSKVMDISDDDIQSVMGYIRRGLSSSIPVIAEARKDTIEKNIAKKVPILFPPGECIHFYRDGSGISGTYVNCDFFNEIDIARTMVDDHLISSGYRRIFLSLMRDFHKDDHFSFDSKGTGNPR